MREDRKANAPAAPLLPSAVERLARLVVKQLVDQVNKPTVVQQPSMAALGQCPAQRAQHQRSDVVDVVEDVLVGVVRRADVGLVVEIGAREAGLDRRKLDRFEIRKVSRCRHGGLDAGLDARPCHPHRPAAAQAACLRG